MRRLVSRRLHVPTASLLAVVLVSAGCAAQTPTKEPTRAGVSPVHRPEDLYVIDCLLPAQIRKLGRSMTYLAPRRAIKTSAADCEIRGGEFVAYDRSDYATALRVWLPQAQEGDTLAQTYVGEIYEKGLGLGPDYALAAAWYRKAADHGFARAQINLGHLYEQGLGVEKDGAKALSWYRRASGLNEAIVLDSGTINTTVAAEVRELKEEVQRRKRETDSLRSQLERTRQQLDQTRQEFEKRSAEVDGERRRVADLRRELDTVKHQADALRDDSKVRALEEQVARRQADLDGQRREVARLRQQVVVLEAAEVREKEEVDRRKREADSLRSQLERTRQQLEQARQEFEKRSAEADGQRRRVADVQRDLDTMRQQADALRDDSKVRALEKQVTRRQIDLDAQRQEVARLHQQIAALEGEAERSRQQLAALNAKQAELAGPTVEVIEPSILPTRGVVAVPVSIHGAPLERLVVGRVVAPAGLLALTVNNREERVDEGGLFRLRIPVPPGGVAVNVVAVDRQGKRGTAEFRLVPDSKQLLVKLPSTVALGQYHALIIGNRHYAHWPGLKTSEADAVSTAEILNKKYGFKTRLLLDAKRVDILQALNDYRNQLTEKDNLLIYYAGHGHLDEKINRAYWIPVDAQVDSNVEWISAVAITDVVGAMSAKHVLLVVDSCYSGALTRSALAQLEAGMSPEARLHWLEVVASKRSRTVLSSGAVKPVLDTGGGEHSVFARAWLDVLQKNDEVLEGQRVHREIAQRVAYAADTLQFEQVPEYAPIRYAGHESGDFLFVLASN
jgi:predicted  nucleic acid-binding Zn-ribbon protein